MNSRVDLHYICRVMPFTPSSRLLLLFYRVITRTEVTVSRLSMREGRKVICDAKFKKADCVSGKFNFNDFSGAKVK